MKLDFNTIPEKVIPAFKGGTGEAHVRRYEDAMGAVVFITLPAGSSIGLHTHVGNCEVVRILSGHGKCIDDGEEYLISAGTVQYCPEGHSHSIINTGNEPLTLLGVLPNSK